MNVLRKVNVAERVRSLIATHLGKHVESDAASLIDLGVDSLDKIELAFVCESAFGIYMDDSDLEGLANVGDVIRLIERLVGERKAA